MPLLRRFLIASALLPGAAWFAAAGRAQGQGQAPLPLFVCAVTGLEPGFQALEPLWRGQGNRPLRFTFAPTATLLRLFDQGHPCDLLALSDPPRMAALEQRRLLRQDSNRTMLGNELVVVTLAEQPFLPRLAAPFALPELLGTGRLALPDPAASPVGRAAREALQNLELWDSLAPRLLRTADSATALALLRRGEARAMIATGTEALATPGLRLALTLPADSHQPLRYAFALPRRGDVAAQELLAFLAGPAALPVWQRLGFGER
jgi:molybdate transport system substrate-binding protein